MALRNVSFIRRANHRKNAGAEPVRNGDIF